MHYLIIIQARLGSTRFPNKVMEPINGTPMVKRVWLAAKDTAKFLGSVCKVVVAWPERYPDLPENNVLERFRRIAREFGPNSIIRLTADCPLIAPADITFAISRYEEGLKHGIEYYNNRKDGRDVQIFTYRYLFDNLTTHKEHVIKDVPNTGGLSVDTREDLEKVKKYAR